MSLRVWFLFRGISLIAIAIVMSIFYVLLPTTVWTATSVGALVMFCITVGMTFCAPYLLPARRSENDAGQIASIGTLAVAVPLLLSLTALSFLLSLTGLEKIVWILMILAGGVGFIAVSLIFAAAELINDISGATVTASSRSLWLASLQTLNEGNLEPPVLQRLSALVEKLRYAAADVGTRAEDANAQIGNLVDALYDKANAGSAPNAELIECIDTISGLVDKREIILRAIKTKP